MPPPTYNQLPQVLRGLQRAVPGQGGSPFGGNFSPGQMSPGMGANPALELDDLQGSFIDETKDRLFNAMRAPSPSPSSINVEALQSLLGRQEADRAGSFINEVQEPQVNAIRGANLGAAMQGFGDPQEQAHYARSIDEERMRLPLEQSKIQQGTAIKQAELQNQGAMDRLQEQNRFTQGIIEQGGGWNPATGGYTASGRGGVNFSRPVAGAMNKSSGMALNSAAHTSLIAARRDLAQQEAEAQRMSNSPMRSVGKFFGLSGDSPDTPGLVAAKAGFEQAIQNALIQLTPNVELQQMASDILTSPDRDRDLQEILGVQGPDFQITPEEVDQLQRILEILRLPLAQGQIPPQ